jgi:hypothetical protein
MPDVPAHLRRLRSCAFLFCTRGCGCLSGARHSLRPYLKGNVLHNLGEKPSREGIGVSRSVIASDSEAIQFAVEILDRFVAFAPLRKRFAFVAGDDGAPASPPKRRRR